MECCFCKKEIDDDSQFCTHCGSDVALTSLSRIWNVGRNPDNDIVEEYSMVSSHHCRILLEDGKLFVEDLNSTNGTFVNGRKAAPFERTPFQAEDNLRLGSHPFSTKTFLAPSRAGGRLSPEQPAPHAIAVTEKETIFGRDPAATICLNSPQVSWRHARLLHTGDRFFLEDLGSTNGTFVNGSRILSCRITPDDAISFGSFSFRLTPDQKIEKRDYRGDIRLSAENLTVKVADRGTGAVKRLVNNISLTIYPSEFVGVMGPSGCGKTTFLLALNGYLPPQSGRSLINGQSLYDQYDAFRNCIGYVPQDDILHAELTVYEALYYTARLRLPMDTTDREIDARIEAVLAQLGLVDKSRQLDIRNVPIGSAEKKGISGGQRKRLNLAMELLTDPSLLFLDEPTSGLSSEDTVTVMTVLRQLADAGKTILLVIHQPSLEVYKKLDNVVILSSGKLMYYGPAYPDSLCFFNPDHPQEQVAKNADNVLKGFASRPEREWEEAYRQSAYFERYVKSRKQHASVSKKSALEDVRSPSSFAFEARQWWTLTRRYFTVKRKDSINTAILFLQAPVIAMLISVVFQDQGRENAPTPLFLLIVSALWFGTSNSAREIVAEKAIYGRERMVNLGIPAYVLSKYAVLGLLCFLQCAALVGIVHSAVDLDGAALSVFFIIFLVALAGLSIGLFLSSLTGTQQAAIAIVPLVLLPMVILGGGMRPVKEMASTASALALLVPSRWAYEKLLRIEDAGKDKKRADKEKEASEPAEDAVQPPSHERHSILVAHFFGDRVHKDGLILFVLTVFIVGFMCLAMLALKTKDKV